MTYFSWRGEPITDIRAWAEERGEPMVTVIETQTSIQPTTTIGTTRLVQMPRCFADGLPTYEDRGAYRISRRVLA